MQEHRQIKNVYFRKGKLFTKAIVSGKVYGERITRDAGEEYREWDVTKSKLGAAIAKGASQIGIKKGNIILYLGASSGTTISHVSDIVGKEGFVFGVEFAPRMIRELVFVCEKRKNIAPILVDASKINEYKDKICEVDCVFQDIAQREQVKIFLKNLVFLRKGGFGIIAIKARSIDVTENPKKIFKKAREELENTKGISVVDYRELEPYEKDHCVIIVKKN